MGGITYIVAAMGNHERSARIQEHACAALWNLAVNGTFFEGVVGPLFVNRSSFNQELNRKKIATQNGIERIILAMRVHSRNVKIQALACGALRTLATDSTILTC